MEKKKKTKRMRELVELLNKARRAYEQENTEIMSNFEYDRLYDELLSLEKELETTLASSPTVNVGYEVLSELPKERHETPMLSLDKTKDVERLREFLGDQQAVISWKMDGLTIVLTYENGVLKKAVTRGNGEIGEVVTNNAKVFRNVPLSIPFKGELVLRGEAVISYKDFEKINEEIEDVDAKYILFPHCFEQVAERDFFSAVQFPGEYGVAAFPVTFHQDTVESRSGSLCFEAAFLAAMA